jgi:hypothetical protein
MLAEFPTLKEAEECRDWYREHNPGLRFEVIEFDDEGLPVD